MDIILISCTRSNPSGAVGFLHDYRRVNVATTRAKCGLILVGHAMCLASDPNWNAMLQQYNEEECIVSGPLHNLKPVSLKLPKPKETAPDNSEFVDVLDGHEWFVIETSNNGTFRCKMCDVIISGSDDFESHENGHLHQLKMKQIKK
ncbi:hypothetical protein WR25_16757 [Diploscapter pachys]|uniref:C2H2-type domain-containing protein n=1 Tax=Diploscapter pachys TaxID=2018661 RepID=A0A2A2KZP0_9BILA|nr:hypothetical protein WR25_16757 [Diploscapter pachys]